MIKSKKNETHPFTHQSLIQRVQQWDISSRIAEKYQAWQLKYPLPNLSSPWIKLIQHTLVYYLLKNIQWLFLNHSAHHILLHSHSMKLYYTQIALIHGEEFDFKLIILIKTISYFIGTHIHQILVDIQLQNDIYQLVIRNLLGISVEPNTYRTLLKSLKNTEYIKQQRESIDLETLLTFPLKQNTINTTFSLGRRNAKNQNQFFDRLLDMNLQNSKLQEIKKTLRENLYVKPIVRPRTPKHSINELHRKADGIDSVNCLHKRHLTTEIIQWKRTPQIIQSNQLSNAFTLNTQLKLNNIKKFPIRCSPSKQQYSYAKNYPPTLKQKGPKLQIKRQLAQQGNRVTKSTKNWNGIVTQMKEKLYKGVKTSNNQQIQKESYYQQLDLLSKYTRQNEIIGVFDGMSIALQTKSPKFRKLNLINSSNINIQAESDSQENEAFTLAKKNYSLFHIKNRNSQLQNASTRRRMNFWEKGRVSACSSDLNN